MCNSIQLDNATTAQPRWGLLYGATLLPLGALAIVEASVPAEPLATVLRYGLALVTFATMGTWVWSSRATLDLQEWCSCAAATISVRVIESSRPVAVPLPAPLDPLPAWAEETGELVPR